MAGNPVGTMYVELSLDATKYTKAQKDILAGAEKNSADINKVFKTVGTQSDEMYNAMRKNVENSLAAIKQSHLSSADEIRRAQESAAAKIKSINEQQYGHHESLIEGIKKNWVGMAAAATAAFLVVKNIVAEPIAAYMESEKALLKMGMAMKNQGDFTREALEDLEDFAAQVQKTTAYEDDATLAVMGNLKSFGMSNEEVKRATQTAIDFATAKANEGMTITTAAELLGKAYAGNTGMLGRYGIVIDSTLESGKKFEAVMGQLEQRFGGSAQAELLTYAGQWKQLKNQWGDIQEFMGLVFLKTIEAVGFSISMMGAGFWTVAEMILSGWGKIVGAMGDVSKFIGLEKIGKGLESISSGLSAGAKNAQEASAAAIKNADANYKNMVSFDNVAVAIDNMGKAGKRTQAIDEEALKAAKKSAEERAAAIKSITEEIRKANVEIEGIGKSQYVKDLARIASEEKEWNRKTQNDVSVVKWKAAQIELLERRLEEETTKSWRKQADAAVGAMQKEIEQGAKLSDESMKRIKERGDAARDLYKDMKGYEQDYYNESMKLIESQAERYRALGLDEAAIAKYVADEQAKAYIKMGQASNDWVTGVKVGLMEITRDHTTWGNTAYEVTKTFADSAKSELSTNLFNVMKGNFKEVGLDWGKMWDAMLGTLSDKIAKMIVEAAANAIIMKFSASWTDAGVAVLGIIDKLMGFVGVTSTLSADATVQSLAEGAPGSFAYGGQVPGYAFGGNSPANDTVPAWLSPGEYVIPRTGVNPDTITILEYIRSFGKAPQYAIGGIVAAEQPYQIMNPDYRRFLDDRGRIFNVPDIDQIADSWTYRKQNGTYIDGNWIPDVYDFTYGELNGESAAELAARVSEYYANGGTTIINNPKTGDTGTWFDQLMMGFHEGITSVFGTVFPAIGGVIDSLMKPLSYAVQAAVAAMHAYSFGFMSPVYAAMWAGSTATALSAAQNAGEVNWGSVAASTAAAWLASELATTSAFDADTLQGLAGASLSPEQLADLQAMTFNAAGQGTAASIPSLGMDVAKATAKTVIRDILFGSTGKAGSLSLSFDGGSGSALFGDSLQNLIGPGNKNAFAFSAKNGLDYVPYDNFLINAHRGERVQTADERENLAAEIRGLRDDVRSIAFQLVDTTKKMLRLEEDWTEVGLLTRTS